MSIQRRQFLATLTGIAAVGTAGCLGNNSDENTAQAAEITDQELRLTTTTSTYDTGLLDEINQAFEDRFGVAVQAVAQGTGAALETARSGDSDVVMVHARELEDEFMRDGYGINRRDLMFNDFVIVGPSDDPAGIGGGDDAVSAFSTIAETETEFVSRGDNSGTHSKERSIWAEADIAPDGDWYIEAGQGMGEVLSQTNQRGGYTLADRGTYLSMREEIGIEILVEGPINDGPELLANPYGIVAVNPAVHEGVAYDIAMAYIGFITSRDGQQLIDEFRANGEQLFFAEALSADPNFEQYVPADWRTET